MALFRYRCVNFSLDLIQHTLFDRFDLAGCTFHGTTACLFGLVIIQHFHPMPDVFPGRPGDIAPAEFLTAVAGGLWLANLAVLWRTTTR
jgi:hypothetical protein